MSGNRSPQDAHSVAMESPMDPKMSRAPLPKTTYSMNCTYAGNTLLLKKGNHRFSVDRAVYR